MKTLSMILTIFFIFIVSSTAFALQASSDTRPAKYVKSRGKIQVNYNIHQVTVKDMDGKPHKIWEYNYVEVDPPVTKAKFKESLRQEDLRKKDEKPWIPDIVVEEYKQEKTESL